ncbi:hypothetical protein FWK35_00029088 [Aphis craccivora]|uniref:Uncharacterized protein n=1 Tax=Aphis craccivora TaxID=307492 RepID=A0A6G0ZLT9_APHCR|nr:hypothetical protein FWK35_00029088 [Aphis craccivora]
MLKLTSVKINHEPSKKSIMKFVVSLMNWMKIYYVSK